MFTISENIKQSTWLQCLQLEMFKTSHHMFTITKNITQPTWLQCLVLEMFKTSRQMFTILVKTSSNLPGCNVYN